jgi:hypothetical protein
MAPISYGLGRLEGYLKKRENFMVIEAHQVVTGKGIMPLQTWDNLIETYKAKDDVDGLIKALEKATKMSPSKS